MTDDVRRRGLSRRQLLQGAAAGAAFAAGGGTLFAAETARGAGGGAASGPDPCAWSRDVLLHNGKFVDYRGAVADAITVKDGRIVKVGQAKDLGSCSQRINCRGRTVIPGLVDSHCHFIRCGINPGHEVRAIETSFSIAELQETIAARAATVPAGEFLTCIGGWNRNQFAERRLPTLAELDAAAPAHPVYISATGGGGGAVTNSLGKAFFEAHGVAVAADGTLPTGPAVAALTAEQTEEDRQRGTRDLMSFSAGLGLTTVQDVGGLAGFDDYDYALDLWRAKDLDVRIRHSFWSGNDPTIEIMKQRITQGLNRIGDDVYRTNGVGERVNTSSTSALFAEACLFAAEHGWSLNQHSNSVAELSTHIAAFEAANAAFPIGDLRWSLAHVVPITEAQLQQLIAIGATVNVQDFPYTGTAGGPPFRMIVDSGIVAGGGTDATNVAPLSPWLSLFYMITGRNVSGDVINAGQQITRLEALRLYTMDSAYLSYDDELLGSFEVGKLADLAVLSGDYLKVPDDQIRKLRSDLTLQGGRVVHASGPFADLAP
jgi:predicted amidohydrolase YtcJ